MMVAPEDDELDDEFDDEGWGWTEVAGTGAAYRWEHRDHEGVPVLMVWLRGSVSRYGDEVAKLRGALDRIPAEVWPRITAELATLDVRRFANADGDECSILTGVFSGMPCVWITDDSAGQDEGGRRWELPPLRWLAETEAEALDIVTGLRRAGRYWETSAGLMRDEPRPSDALEVWVEAWWDARGFRARSLDHGLLDCHYRNRLVERQLGREEPVRVLWPVPDASGEVHQAMRCGARLVYRGERVVEVDLRPYVIRRAPDEHWLDRLAELDAIEELELDEVPVSDAQIVEVLSRWPSLRMLDLGSEARVGRAVLERLLDGAGPKLERLRCGPGLDRELRGRLRRARPELTFA